MNEPKANFKSESAVSQTVSKPVPILFVGLLILLVYLGMLYLGFFGGMFKEQVYQPYTSFAAVDSEQFKDPMQEFRLNGQKIFNASCSPCHQASGLGVAGQYPPLVASEWVNAKGPNRIIRAVLCGLGGPINVKGAAYNNNMVAWRDNLKDEEIAAVLTFVRQNKEWSNDAPAVTPEQVAAVRAKVKDRIPPFTEAELLKISETE